MMTPDQRTVYQALDALRDAGLVTGRERLNAAYFALTEQENPR